MGTEREVIIVRVLALDRIPEVGLDPFAPDVLVRDAACNGVLDGDEGLDEEPGGVDEEEDGHVWTSFWLRGGKRLVLRSDGRAGEERERERGSERYGAGYL